MSNLLAAIKRAWACCREMPDDPTRPCCTSSGDCVRVTPEECADFPYFGVPTAPDDNRTCAHIDCSCPDVEDASGCPSSILMTLSANETLCRKGLNCSPQAPETVSFSFSESIALSGGGNVDGYDYNGFDDIEISGSGCDPTNLHISAQVQGNSCFLNINYTWQHGQLGGCFAQFPECGYGAHPTPGNTTVGNSLFREFVGNGACMPSISVDEEPWGHAFSFGSSLILASASFA